MKLSKKGAKKVSTNCKNVMVIGTDDFFPPTILDGAENLEFDQSDFTGAVVLTVEEAKAVLECVDACAFPSPFEGFVSENILLRDKLKKRIEQAEKKK